MNIDFSSFEFVRFSGLAKLDTSSPKLIGLYFSAHWCPPSRLFTPKLINLYNLINSDKTNFEIISVSFERDLSCWESYFEEMPWLSIPFSNEKLRNDIAQQLKVANPFKLLVFTPQGKLVSTKGIEDLRDKGSEAFDYWLLSSDSMSNLKSPPLCQSEHLMSLASHKKEKKCGTCSKNIVLGWECTDCSIVICNSCQEWISNSPSEPSISLCLNMHTLRKTQSLKEFYMNKYLYSNYNCRTCNELQKGEGLHCRPCLFDICFNCFSVISKSKDLPKSTCSEKHELTWSSNLCMILQEKFGFCQFRCEECGESYLGGGAFACIECEFYQCVKCFTQFNKENLKKLT